MNTEKKKWLLLLNLFGLSLFLLMLINVLTEGSMLTVDKWVHAHIDLLRTPPLTEWVIMLTNTNGMVNSYIFAFCVILILAYNKWYAEIWFYIGVTLGSTALFISVKYLAERTRPASDVIEVTGYSFPSGHTTMATAMAIALYVVFSRKIPSPTFRMIFLTACLIWPLLIGFSRIYLSVHWSSDVLGGLGFGLFWSTLFYMLYVYFTKETFTYKTD